MSPSYFLLDLAIFVDGREVKLIEGLCSYRGSRTINLSATSWRYEDDRFLQDGKLLSDHNPIAANFTWERSASLRQSDLFGGPHG